jgi:aryl-alcohol dehydrogenase-like predicted oxidoreductase
MDDLVRQGRILYWGVSCWNETQIADALSICDRTGAARPVSNQPPYNLIERGIEERVLPLCKKEGLGQLVFSPLAEGLLTGKYRQGRLPEGSRAANDRTSQFLRPRLTERNLRVVDRLAKIAEDAGLTLPRLALAWAMRDAGVASVIMGATRPEQVRENAAASGVKLGDDVLREIETALAG